VTQSESLVGRRTTAATRLHRSSLRVSGGGDEPVRTRQSRRCGQASGLGPGLAEPRTGHRIG